MSSKENVSIDIKSIIIPGLTQQKIEDYANDNRLYKRGLDCYKQGIVSEVSKIEKSVQATVFGSNDQEYSVKISFDDRVINIFKCTCPYDGGVCKHLVAVMLYCLYDADKVLQSQPLNELLSKLDKSHLCTLIETSAER